MEQYIKRIVDSPGVATYLVINTTSDQYESTIGRFSGSLEMMKAVGFEYNSEKKLLTLNDHSITVGKISPDFIEVLKGRLKEIQSHHAAIDHTDISNVAAGLLSAVHRHFDFQKVISVCAIYLQFLQR